MKHKRKKCEDFVEVEFLMTYHELTEFVMHFLYSKMYFVFSLSDILYFRVRKQVMCFGIQDINERKIMITDYAIFQFLTPEP